MRSNRLIWPTPQAALPIFGGQVRTEDAPYRAHGGAGGVGPLSWTFSINSAQYSGPLVSYPPEHFTRATKEYLDDQDISDRGMHWYEEILAQEGKQLDMVQREYAKTSTETRLSQVEMSAYDASGLHPQCRVNSCKRELQREFAPDAGDSCDAECICRNKACRTDSACAYLNCPDSCFPLLRAPPPPTTMEITSWSRGIGLDQHPLARGASVSSASTASHAANTRASTPLVALSVRRKTSTVTRPPVRPAGFAWPVARSKSANMCDTPQASGTL